MPTFRKTATVEAIRWFKQGDHPSVEPYKQEFTDRGLCGYCNKLLVEHGWVQTLEGGHIVCPGDWILTGIEGENYPCKPDIFERTYEEVIG